MKHKINLGANAYKAKKAIKGILESVKEVNINFDFEQRVCNIEIKGK